MGEPPEACGEKKVKNVPYLTFFWTEAAFEVGCGCFNETFRSALCCSSDPEFFRVFAPSTTGFEPLLGQTALITTFLADAQLRAPTPANASNLAV